MLQTKNHVDRTLEKSTKHSNRLDESNNQLSNTEDVKIHIKIQSAYKQEPFYRNLLKFYSFHFWL